MTLGAPSAIRPHGSGWCAPQESPVGTHTPLLLGPPATGRAGEAAHEAADRAPLAPLHGEVDAAVAGARDGHPAGCRRAAGPAGGPASGAADAAPDDRPAASRGSPAGERIRPRR